MADLAPRAVIEEALTATAGLFAKAPHISLRPGSPPIFRRSAPMRIASSR